jgi:hypothetical protein
MAQQTWSTVLRQILLRGNFYAGDQATLATAYATTPITDASITKSGGEYSFLALSDVTLQALAMIIRAIGENRESEHRIWFTQDTPALPTGSQIPTLAADGRSERYGVLANVRDADDDTYLTSKPRRYVRIARSTSRRRKLSLYHYFSDDVIIEHTRSNVKAEIVAWDRQTEAANIVANNVSVCPLPDALLPDLEFGVLAFIWRDKFNLEQAMANAQKFAASLNAISGKQVATAETVLKQ